MVTKAEARLQTRQSLVQRQIVSNQPTQAELETSAQTRFEEDQEAETATLVIEQKAEINRLILQSQNKIEQQRQVVSNTSSGEEQVEERIALEQNRIIELRRILPQATGEFTTGSLIASAFSKSKTAVPRGSKSQERIKGELAQGKIDTSINRLFASGDASIQFSPEGKRFTEFKDTPAVRKAIKSGVLTGSLPTQQDKIKAEIAQRKRDAQLNVLFASGAARIQRDETGKQTGIFVKSTSQTFDAGNVIIQGRVDKALNKLFTANKAKIVRDETGKQVGITYKEQDAKSVQKLSGTLIAPVLLSPKQDTTFKQRFISNVKQIEKIKLAIGKKVPFLGGTFIASPTGKADTVFISALVASGKNIKSRAEKIAEGSLGKSEKFFDTELLGPTGLKFLPKGIKPSDIKILLPTKEGIVKSAFAVEDFANKLLRKGKKPSSAFGTPSQKAAVRESIKGDRNIQFSNIPQTALKIGEGLTFAGKELGRRTLQGGNLLTTKIINPSITQIEKNQFAQRYFPTESKIAVLGLKAGRFQSQKINPFLAGIAPKTAGFIFLPLTSVAVGLLGGVQKFTDVDAEARRRVMLEAQGQGFTSTQKDITAKAKFISKRLPEIKKELEKPIVKEAAINLAIGTMIIGGRIIKAATTKIPLRTRGGKTFKLTVKEERNLKLNLNKAEGVQLTTRRQTQFTTPLRKAFKFKPLGWETTSKARIAVVRAAGTPGQPFIAKVSKVRGIKLTQNIKSTQEAFKILGKSQVGKQTPVLIIPIKSRVIGQTGQKLTPDVVQTLKKLPLSEKKLLLNLIRKPLKAQRFPGVRGTKFTNPRIKVKGKLPSKLFQEEMLTIKFQPGKFGLKINTITSRNVKALLSPTVFPINPQIDGLVINQRDAILRLQQTKGFSQQTKLASGKVRIITKQADLTPTGRLRTFQTIDTKLKITDDIFRIKFIPNKASKAAIKFAKTVAKAQKVGTGTSTQGIIIEHFKVPNRVIRDPRLARLLVDKGGQGFLPRLVTTRQPDVVFNLAKPRGDFISGIDDFLLKGGEVTRKVSFLPPPSLQLPASIIPPATFKTVLASPSSTGLAIDLGVRTLAPLSLFATTKVDSKFDTFATFDTRQSLFQEQTLELDQPQLGLQEPQLQSLRLSQPSLVETVSDTKLDLSQPTVQQSPQISIFQIPQGQRARTRQNQAFAQETLRIPIAPLVPVKFNPKTPLAKKLLKLRKKNEGVDVIVGMKLGKRKVIARNVRPFTGLRKGQNYADKNIEASFTLVPSKKTPKGKKKKPVNVGKKFRPSKVNPLFVVEKKRFRLDSPGEKRQIKRLKSKTKRRLKRR